MAENFDNEAFYAALNAVRLSRQMTWKDVAEETGVNASTLSRIGQGANPDVNGLAALLAACGRSTLAQHELQRIVRGYVSDDLYDRIQALAIASTSR